ncbi:YciI family protein [[Actinomadura] parvosata]|uniref:YciI family protein n=1 Tax=[Actinomadura] parvosata TaxID=1955412 RepID=UPI00406C4A83
MKYMILSYASQREYDEMSGKGDTWSAADLEAMTTFMATVNKELEESGELVETRGLAAPVHTRRVGTRDGVPYVTDGPYAETQEVLAGYWVVECESFDRAVEIAGRLGRCPTPEGATATMYADIRPIMESADDLGF